MQINSINNSNYKQTLTCKKPSFKSVIPVKVFIDDLPSTDLRNINRGILRLYKILSKSVKNNTELEMKTKFLEHVKDFKLPNSSQAKKASITSSHDFGKFYLFTGPEAEKLADMSDEIGYAQRDGLINHDTSRTFEAKTRKKEYFEQIKKFINSKAKIREKINPTTKEYEGEEIGLCIFTTSKGTPGKKNFRLVLDKIAFRKIKNNQIDIPSATSSKANEKTAPKSYNGGQLNLFK